MECKSVKTTPSMDINWYWYKYHFYNIQPWRNTYNNPSNNDKPSNYVIILCLVFSWIHIYVYIEFYICWKQRLFLYAAFASSCIGIHHHQICNYLGNFFLTLFYIACEAMPCSDGNETNIFTFSKLNNIFVRC